MTVAKTTPVDQPRRCLGCGADLTGRHPNARRCRKDCGRTAAQANRARDQARAAGEDLYFVGIDGEGVGRATGGRAWRDYSKPGSPFIRVVAHDYVLLSIGDESLHHPDGRALELGEIFSFIWDYTRRHPKAILVGFFLGYDFTMWLRQLPEDRARMLLTREGRAARTPRGTTRQRNPTPFPVRWQGWELDILGFRRFKLRREGARSWAWICDVGAFWQESLLRVIDPANWDGAPVCSDEDYALIVEGKAQRDLVLRRGAPVPERVIRYNVAENRALAAAMTRLREGFHSFGVDLRRNQWFGPGQAAQAWLRAECPEHHGAAIHAVTPPEVVEAARASYYGGWFEITAHGPIPGTVWEYDINSAYPAQIARLPCLLHGSWRREAPRGGQWRPPRGRNQRGPLRLELVQAEVAGGDRWLGPVPHRGRTGAVWRPLWSAGWYWAHELAAAHRAGLVASVTELDRWVYDPCACPPPIKGIATLYRHRVKGNTKRTPKGKALKLVYNSVYGKTAQSVGAPRWSNALYASLITAGCRAQILDAIATHPERSRSVVMVATDGVYFTSPHPGLRLSERTLGAWDAAELTGLFLFKPGVYWHGARTQVKAKTRGVPLKAFTDRVPVISERWAEFVAGRVETPYAWPFATVEVQFSFLTLPQALERNAWDRAGEVYRSQSFEHSARPTTKRAPLRDANPFDSVPYRSSPHDNPRHLWSVPYPKLMGADPDGLLEFPETIDGPGEHLFLESFNMADVLWN